LIKEGMIADIAKDNWNTYKKGIKIKQVNDDIADENRKTLTLLLPPSSTYKIPSNQKITMNISSSLIEDWPGTVETVEFEIKAKPRISLGGNITKETTLKDIQKGGKVIELKLVNAVWI